MAISSTATGVQDAGAGSLPSRLPDSEQAGNDDLRRAQPVMGPTETVDNPIPYDPELIRQTLSAEGEISIRRRRPLNGISPDRPAAVTVHEAAEDEGSHSVLKVRNAEHKKFESIFSGYGFGKSATRWLSFQYLCCDRVSESLAGSHRSLSEKQRQQAIWLCIVDLHREMIFLESFRESQSAGDRFSPETSPRFEKIHQAVRGLKKHFAYQCLHAVLHDWDAGHPEGQESVRDRQYHDLVTNIGLFDTNAQRFLNAYAQALAAVRSQGGTTFQYFPACLASQWMTGPGTEQREALDRKAGVAIAEFHRKLNQQYGLVCHSFGLPLPPMAELIVLDIECQIAGLDSH